MSMLSRMPTVLAKLAELAVAGVASAAGAYLFGQFTKPVAPPPPPAEIVRIDPVQEELVRAVRSENAALIEELRKAEAAKEAKETTSDAGPPRVAAMGAAKSPKPNQSAGTSHKAPVDRGGLATERKGERAYEVEIKTATAPAEERAQSAAAAPLVLAPIPAPGINPSAQAVDATAAIDQSPDRDPEFRWFARLKRIPDIFRPAPPAPSAAPRPPLPVGDFVQGAM